MQHTIKVRDVPHTVITHRKSKTVWIASGTYMGKNVVTQGSTEGAALKRWAEAARVKAQHPCDVAI